LRISFARERMLKRKECGAVGFRRLGLPFRKKKMGSWVPAIKAMAIVFYGNRFHGSIRVGSFLPLAARGKSLYR